VDAVRPALRSPLRRMQSPLFDDRERQVDLAAVVLCYSNRSGRDPARDARPQREERDVDAQHCQCAFQGHEAGHFQVLLLTPDRTIVCLGQRARPGGAFNTTSFFIHVFSEYPKSSCSLLREQFDLANVTTSSIELFGDQSRDSWHRDVLHFETYPQRWMRTVVGTGSKSVCNIQLFCCQYTLAR